jgi:hypothetical protein
MEEKELEYTLKYVSEDGKPGIKLIRIHFIPQRRREEYFKIQEDIDKAAIAYSAYKAKLAEISSSKILKVGEDAIEKLGEDLQKIAAEIESIGSDSFFKRRADLINKILVQNGVKQGDILLNPNFWEECVDVDVMLDFLKSAVNKDLSVSTEKKKTGTSTTKGS